LPAEAWTTLEVRDGSKGVLKMDLVVTRVLAITERTHDDAVETLVVTRREEQGGVVLDYWLSSAPGSTPCASFARAANQRQAIEQCLQFAKGEAGLADYEVRTWHGWHHHQTLSLLACWFLTLETIGGKKTHARAHRPATPRRHRPLARATPSLRRRTHRDSLPATTCAQ
jgi:SRSO17 transposase